MTLLTAISPKGKVMRSIHISAMPMLLSLLLAVALKAGPVLAQQQMSAEEEAIYKMMIKNSGIDPDMVAQGQQQTEAAQRWTEGDGIVDYHIVGVFEGRANVVGGGNGIGYADVTDQVEIDLQWNLSEAMLEGTPSIVNSKSVMKNLRDPEPSCLPPILKGEYEHYHLEGVKQGLSGALELQVQTSYPEVEVAQFCTGGRKTVPASLDTRPAQLPVPSPVMLGMPLPDSDDLRISPDKKSLIQKKGDWIWTFTPSK
jgi:hypothetical protein